GGVEGGGPRGGAGRRVVRRGLVLGGRGRDRRWRCPREGPPEAQRRLQRKGGDRLRSRVRFIGLRRSRFLSASRLWRREDPLQRRLGVGFLMGLVRRPLDDRGAAGSDGPAVS